MGRFIVEKSWPDRLREIYYSITDLPLMNKIYIGFFVFLFAAIAVGTQMTDKKKTVKNYAAERTAEPDTAIEKLLDYVKKTFLNQ